MGLFKPFFKPNKINSSNYTIKFRDYMIIILCIILLIVMALFFLALYLTLKSRWLNWKAALIVFGLLATVITLALYSFIKRVYQPLVQVEKAIKGMDENGKLVLPDFGRRVSPLMKSLNHLLMRLKEYTDREYTAQFLKKQAEIELLQNQINPHFLYNTLEAIRGQALVEGVNQIADMTESLATFFRYSISRKGKIVTLADELRNVDNYLKIQQYRFNNKFTISKKIDDSDADIFEYQLPKLTLQPIIENAIYHGLETKIGKGAITIRAYVTVKRLVITIKDDGVGMTSDKLDQLNQSLISGVASSYEKREPKQSGIALFNVNERIRLYFGDKYGITVSSTPGLGTSVEVVLPANKDDDLFLERGHEK